MKKIVFRSFLTLGLLSIWAFLQTGSVFAWTGYPEVSCSSYGSAASGCNQCFQGNTVYQGQYVGNMYDDFRAGSARTAIFMNSPGTVSTEYLQSGFTWMDSSSMWKLNSALFTEYSPTRGWYIALEPGQTASAYVQSAPGTGIQFVSGPLGTGDRNAPTYKLTYDTIFYTSNTGFSSPESHKECVFYYSNWCGDGVQDAQEDCDLGAQNGTSGSSCPANCKLAPFDLSLKKYVSGQDAQDGSPVTVVRGDTVNYTFEARNNGPNQTQGRSTVSDVAFPAGVRLTWVSGSGWTCTHTTDSFSCHTDAVVQSGGSFPVITATASIEQSAVAGSALKNYSCIRNSSEDRTNNFWNNNCDPANVIINQPNGPSCTPGVTNGVQSNPVSSSTAGLCPAGQTVGNFGSTTVGNTITYTWSCGNSQVGGQCQATYTPVNPGLCTPGTTTGAQSSAVTAATAGLCPAGQTVGGFGSTTAGTVTTYTWSCNGSSVGGSCTASYDTGGGTTGTPCTPGTTTGAQSSAVTAATAGLCPAGQTVGGFGSTTAGTVTTYTWSCNGSSVGGSCTASYDTGGGTTPGSSACSTLTASVTSAATATYSSVLTCTASSTAGATPTYQINCGNGQTINGATGTCNYTAFGTNAAFCSVNGETGVAIPNSCRVNITSSTSGGGGPGTCGELSFSVVSNVGSTFSVWMTCTSTAAAGSNPTIDVDCGNGQTLTGSTGICQYNTGAGASFPYTATCRVNGSTQGAPSSSPWIFAPGSCRQSIGYAAGGWVPTGGGGVGAAEFCGNGVIDQGERVRNSVTTISGWNCTPNYGPDTPATATTPAIPGPFIDYTCRINLDETCDAGRYNGVIINNSVCSNCHTNITSTTTPRANPLTIMYFPSDTSRPQGLPTSSYSWIIGHGVPVFDSGDRFAITSPFPTMLSGYSANMRNSSNLIDPSGTVSTPFSSSECIGVGQIDAGAAGTTACSSRRYIFSVWAGGKVNPSSGGGAGRIFAGDSSTVTGAAKDVNPPLSTGSAVLQSNFIVGVGYLDEPLRVRVSKQAVSNTAGGNAYLGAQVGFSVNAITREFMSSIESGNFVVTSGSKNSATSLSGADTTTGTTSVGSPQVGQSTSSAMAANVTISSASDLNFSKFSKIGDATNIYVLKKGTVTITGNLVLQWVGTLLIEEWTLIVNGNITYADANSSWSFIVVKPASDGVSIQIKNTVETISGVFIALEGKMVWSAPSIVQLSVDGNIYANISELVNSRTFIRANEASSALSTGVTINYSTRAFKNPPPLLSKYLEQYTLSKISR